MTKAGTHSSVSFKLTVQAFDFGIYCSLLLEKTHSLIPLMAVIIVRFGTIQSITDTQRQSLKST